MKNGITIPSLWGGLFIFLITIVPGINLVNCACGAGIAGGGVFAVYMYHRSNGRNMKINAGTGMVIGLFSGVIGAVLNFGFAMVIMRFFNVVSYNFSLNSFDTQWSDWHRYIDPIVISRFAPFIVFAVSLVFHILLASVGGLIGASIFGQGNNQKKYSSIDKPHDHDSDGIVVEKDSHY